MVARRDASHLRRAVRLRLVRQPAVRMAGEILVELVDRSDDERPVGQDRLVERGRDCRIDRLNHRPIRTLDLDRYSVRLVLDYACQWRALERHMGELRPDLLLDDDRLTPCRVLEACNGDLAL